MVKRSATAAKKSKPPAKAKPKAKPKAKAKVPTGSALPAPAELERICKGIATLDAIISADWESRYYSFNAAWNAKAEERMASMRNGTGDDWFIVFGKAGAFVKSFWHEHPRADVDAIYAGLPAALEAQRTEPAFATDEITYGGWYDRAWTLRGNAKPLADELAILGGDPAAYRRYAADYFEVDVPLDAIAHVLAGKKLDAKLVARISDERTLAELRSDLAEIGYGA
jgi:hypothetical protein